ncbi:phage tail protein [Xenorhabdus sp. PB30.3]|uniref:phage tail-collar fiber domain-containing protein n=1 Tax=Xenorhabdus sp. PB30.3 TaxID=2788941 RepID=UPI001E65045D|nr:phage tail protein [Xenorhabdus sp. PB30.3]MCC8380182.1 phage tail protein [Xenorhabdus sp. PB30.3]
MSSVITTDFEKWKAQQVAAGQPVVLDEFVFANVPNLDPSKDISRSEKLPAANQIVHRQAVNKTGLASENAVAYSVTLGTEVGNFDFNWIGLMNKASGVIGMITHAPTQKKIRTANGLQGNVLTRSFLLEFEGAATETAITTTAETWQIDFTARLTGMDEMQRLINTDSYGRAAFFGHSFAVIRNNDQYIVKEGLAYVGGLRGVLEFDQTFTGLRNTCIYADFSYQGNLVSQWKTVVKIIVTDELQDYIDAAGYPHYVFAVASVDGDGNTIDWRAKGTLNGREIVALNHEMDRIKQVYATQRALENGLNEKQPLGDYVTRQEVRNGLDEKQPRGDYAINSVLNAVNDNANSRLSKSQHGADIPDKNSFINNLGLRDTVNLAKNAVPNHRTINGKALTDDIRLTPADLGALPISSSKHAAIGYLTLSSGDNLPGMRFIASDAHTIGIEATHGRHLTIFADDPNSQRSYTLELPEKNGTLATVGDVLGNIASINRNTVEKSTSGWWQCGDTGLILQWGRVVSASKEGRIVLPMRFPEAIAFVQMTLSGSNVYGNATVMQLDLDQTSNESFSYALVGTQVRFNWFAVGY